MIIGAVFAIEKKDLLSSVISGGCHSRTPMKTWGNIRHCHGIDIFRDIHCVCLDGLSGNVRIRKPVAQSIPTVYFRGIFHLDIVSAILFEFRAYDTLGEATLIFDLPPKTGPVVMSWIENRLKKDIRHSIIPNSRSYSGSISPTLIPYHPLSIS
ncbi:hypothetical protein ACFL2X_05730 [Candidatus Latescibacterota bacterium]